jgi:hypothetical protein
VTLITSALPMLATIKRATAFNAHSFIGGTERQRRKALVLLKKLSIFHSEPSGGPALSRKRAVSQLVRQKVCKPLTSHLPLEGFCT